MTKNVKIGLGAAALGILILAVFGRSLSRGWSNFRVTVLGLEPSTKNFRFKEFWTRTPEGTREPPPRELWGNLQRVMNNLEAIRAALGGVEMTISSGYRSPWHNRDAGGVPNSYHLKAMAADFVVPSMRQSEVQNVVKRLMDEGKIDEGGIGKGQTFTHYDTKGTFSTWGYNDGRSFTPYWDI